MTQAAAEPVPQTIEKIMSIKLSEFEAGLARLDAAAPATAQNGTYTIAREQGVSITFEKLEPAVLGGLMRLPRARVTLHLNSLEPEERRRFLSFFDQTFQRGGG
jgi:hypothetical protein